MNVLQIAADLILGNRPLQAEELDFYRHAAGPERSEVATSAE